MPNKQHYDVVVIGGGPAGMMAAVTAARRGQRVALLEKNERLGKKLAITGGGRCNITNAELDNRVLLRHYGRAADFLYSPLSQLAVKDTMAYFEDNGLKLVTEARQRVFPASQRAEDVVSFLEQQLKIWKVSVILNCKIIKLVKSNNRIGAVTTNRGQYAATSFILASGGLSRPETGSTGDGFGWLRDLGAEVRQPTPSIVPIATLEKWPSEVSGKSLNARLYVMVDGQRRDRFEGRVLFTHFGLSGPAILNAAAKIGQLLEDGKVTLELDLFPGIDEGACDKQLLSLMEQHKNKQLRSVLKEWLPAGIWVLAGRLLSLDLEQKIHSLSREDRKRLIKLFKHLPLTVSHLLGFDRAVVADGGLHLTEVDTKTMRLKRLDNLFVVGDMLDIQRPSGGYSLQLCWTTGFVAGSYC